MSIFYLINLLNTLSFKKQAGFEHLPYEEGIKTEFSEPDWQMGRFEHLPYEEGIKTVAVLHLVGAEPV